MTQRVYFGTVSQGDGGFDIVFVDFPGCVSAGDTFEQVIVMGHEALQGHIEAMVIDRDPIPEPSTATIEQTSAMFDDPDSPIEGEHWIDVVPVLVDVPDDLDTLPVPVGAALLAEIGKIASDNQAFIEDAIRRPLDERRDAAA